MSELIQAVVTIKDPFTLFAFLAVILLIAFRTKTVPESMFKLVRAKITRDRFYALLNRAVLSAVGGIPGIVRDRRPRPGAQLQDRGAGCIRRRPKGRTRVPSR
jgi:hypothetical protein